MAYLAVFLLLGVVLVGMFPPQYDYEIHLLRGEVSFRSRKITGGRLILKILVNASKSAFFVSIL